MSIALVVNGNTYNYPEVGDANWGQEATDWASAVTSGMLQKAGGLFQLLAETDFGPNFGLKSIVYKSRTANASSAGVLQLANTDSIGWRNNANSNNLLLSVTSGNLLQYGGANVLIAGAASIVNADISATAAIAFSKMAAMSTSKVPVSDGSGFLVASVVTTTELGNLVGTTSNIQTQLDSKQTSGSYITALTGDVVATGPGSSAASIQNNIITNAMVNSSAAIAYSKLALTGSIVNADVNASAAIVRTKLASGTINHVIINDGSGIMSSEAALAISRGGTGQATKAAGFDALSPMTTGGDIIYGGASGAGTRLANGTSGQLLQSNGTTLAPTWITPSFQTVAVIYDITSSQVISSSITNVLYNSLVYDPSTLYNSGSGTFTASSTGIYLVNAYLISPTAIQNQQLSIYASKNLSSTELQMTIGGPSSANTFNTIQINGLISLTSGDTITIQAQTSVNWTVAGGRMSISRV